jgi:hypothetical protein
MHPGNFPERILRRTGRRRWAGGQSGLAGVFGHPSILKRNARKFSF